MGSETANKKVVWLKLDSGIRCREHPSRKHGVKPDRYFVLRFTVDGKTQQEALGWASEGMTLAKARIELARLKEAKRTGEGARSLRERRKQEEKRRKAQEIAERLSGEKFSFSMYWDKFYWPAQAHKAKGSQVAEDALWKKCGHQGVLPEGGCSGRACRQGKPGRFRARRGGRVASQDRHGKITFSSRGMS